MTSRRSAGGKKAGPPRTRGVLKTRQALLEEALPPERDGVTITVEFLGDRAVGGLVGSRSAEDDAYTEREGLRSGSSTAELLEACSILIGEGEGGRIGEGHGSLRATKEIQMSLEFKRRRGRRPEATAVLARDLRNSHLV